MLCCFGPKSALQVFIDDADNLMKKQEYTPAIEKYKECLTMLDWENPETTLPHDKVEKYVIPALVGIAQCHTELKQYHKTLDVCKQILTLRPNHKKAVSLQGMARVQVGDFKGAMKSMPKN
jgi:tetratricopeptide (TPR) repeat protein